MPGLSNSYILTNVVENQIMRGDEMKRFTIFTILGVVAGAAVSVPLLRAERETHEAADIVYVCRETGDVMKAPAGPTPALNPKTGKRTLVRGLYCSKCGEWKPSPPSSAFQSNPRHLRCAKDGTPLATDGPGQE